LVHGLLNLAAQDAAFTYQVAALSAELLKFEVVVGPGRLEQAETVDCGAEDSGQVGVVGFVFGIGRLAELFGRKGVYEPSRHLAESKLA
jgi:hypothetical protein